MKIHTTVRKVYISSSKGGWDLDKFLKFLETEFIGKYSGLLI